MAALAEEDNTLGPILVCYTCGQDIAKPTREKHFMPFQEKHDNNASCYSLMLYRLIWLMSTLSCLLIQSVIHNVHFLIARANILVFL